MNYNLFYYIVESSQLDNLIRNRVIYCRWSCLNLRMRRIIIYWLVFSLILVVGYLFLQVLHSINFWENLGIIPAPDHIEPFSTIGMTFFTMALVVGWSIIFSGVIWKLIGHIYSPSQPIFRLIFELSQSWISLSFFEICIFINFTVLSTLVTNSKNTFRPTGQILLEVAWINFVLVCLFYTFIGIQAARKNLEVTRFVSKLAYDFLQILFMTFEGGLIFLPFGLFEFLINMSNYPVLLLSLLIYSYNAFLAAFIIEFLIWTDERVKKEEAAKNAKTSFRIFILDTSMIVFPLLLIATFMVYPFYIPLQSVPVWIFLVEFLVIFSIFASILYSFGKIIAPRLSKDSLSKIQILKYRFEVLLATRGTMFNYPTPIDIFLGGELTEKIEHRWEKVSLKMACGQCYHVFEAEALRKGTNIKPIPCAFCGSLATTPVWE